LLLFFSAIGDRILTAPQSFGRIVTLPDTEIALIQLDHVLGINGAMISNGTLTDHSTYVNMSNFEWDSSHEYWKPKFTSGDKITLQMTTVRSETPRLTPPVQPPPPRSATPKVSVAIFENLKNSSYELDTRTYGKRTCYTKTFGNE
jgi:hypothetical protein